MKHIVPLLLLMISVTCNAQQVEGTDFKQLLLKAMSSPKKKATADVYGPLAEMIRGRTQMKNARIVAEVSVIKDLPQEGCKRLKMVFTMPGTMLPKKDGTTAPFYLENMLNMCENGQPPDMGDDAAVANASINNMREYEKRSKAYSEKHSEQK